MLTPKAEEVLKYLRKKGRTEKVGRKTIKVVRLTRGYVELCEDMELSRRTLYNVLPLLEEEKYVRVTRLPRTCTHQPVRLEVLK